MRETKPWLRHYPSEVAPTYEYPKHNLARLLVDSANQFPERPALYFLGKKLSYRELLHASYQFAHVLTDLGVTSRGTGIDHAAELSFGHHCLFRHFDDGRDCRHDESALCGDES